jgi:hypothetical protein
MIRKGLILAAALAATAAFLPATGGAATFRGVVIAKQHGSLLVATPGGAVQAVRGRAALGMRIAVSGGGIAVVGRARSAVVRGIVVRRIGTTLVLASNRHLLAIHKARVLADSAPSAPAPGSVVSATVGIRDGELEEEDEDEVGQVNASSIQVQATVASVGAGTVTLTVQGQTLTVPLPAGLTLPASIVGQTVTISLSLAHDDENEQGDDDHGDHHGGGGGDDD